MTQPDLPSYDTVDRLVDEDTLKLRDLAWDLRQQLEQLRATDRWTVDKITHDETRAVGPIIRPNGMINRDAGNSSPAHARYYAAQLLAAADEAERLLAAREESAR